MRFVHLSDLHLGKRLMGFSLLEDQAYILNEILAVIDREAPRAVLISGDVYDKAIPPAEAVALFDQFLWELSSRGLQVMVISGNHDSPERIAFGGRLMDRSGVHLSPVYDGPVKSVTLTDEYGPVRFWLLPFVKPAHVRRYFPEAAIETYTDAVAAVVGGLGADPAERNVLLTHQFVTGADRCDSEDISVGGTDNVDAAAFGGMDYVALGHLHGPQNVGGPGLRYCGTPLKYSFSEKDHQKSVTVVDMGPKGDLTVRTSPLHPLHDLREIRGTYQALTLRSNYAGTDVEDYLHVILTDENDVPDALTRLRTVYPNIMKLDYDNARTRASGTLEALEALENRSELELFAEFYEVQNNGPMTEAQREYCRRIFEELKEAES